MLPFTQSITTKKRKAGTRAIFYNALNKPGSKTIIHNNIYIKEGLQHNIGFVY